LDKFENRLKIRQKNEFRNAMIKKRCCLKFVQKAKMTFKKESFGAKNDP
jgi:hypothetical protein